MQVTLSEFLRCLFKDGRVRVVRPAEISAKERSAAGAVLAAFEREQRRELPGVAPPLCLPAAQWAAGMLYRACQFVAFRDADEEVIARALTAGCPDGDPSPVHYSVDLTFQYLPDLSRLARSTAEQDPLLAYIARWAVDWPLSSVGMAGVAPVKIDVWAADRCLLALYVDRVIARGDTSRLSDRRVREGVQQAVGLFSELSPKMAAAATNGAMPQDPTVEEMQ
jgi:hypothetical protein